MAGTLSVQQLWRIFVRFWLLIIIVALAGGAVAYLATTLLVPRTYEATATQLVKGLPGPQAAADYDSAQYAVSRAKSYPSFIYSATVLEGVRTDLDDGITIQQLTEEILATNPVDTPLVRVTALGRTPAEAREKANSAARHLARFITQIETISGISPVSVEIAVQAIDPTSPVTPRPVLNAALAAFASAALAMAVAIVATRMSWSFTLPRRTYSRKASQRSDLSKTEPSDDWGGNGNQPPESHKATGEGSPAQIN